MQPVETKLVSCPKEELADLQEQLQGFCEELDQAGEEQDWDIIPDIVDDIDSLVSTLPVDTREYHLQRELRMLVEGYQKTLAIAEERHQALKAHLQGARQKQQAVEQYLSALGARNQEINQAL